MKSPHSMLFPGTFQHHINQRPVVYPQVLSRSQNGCLFFSCTSSIDAQYLEILDEDDHCSDSHDEWAPDSSPQGLLTAFADFIEKVKRNGFKDRAHLIRWTRIPLGCRKGPLFSWFDSSKNDNRYRHQTLHTFSFVNIINSDLRNLPRSWKVGQYWI